MGAAEAVITLGRLVKFFPADEMTRELIASALTDFVGRQDELEWLVRLAANVLPEWGGLSELRGLYCTRYRPIDDIEAVSGTPGYRPAELADRAEREFFEREARETDRLLGEYRAAARRMPTPEQEAAQRLLADVEQTELKRI